MKNHKLRRNEKTRVFHNIVFLSTKFLYQKNKVKLSEFEAVFINWKKNLKEELKGKSRTKFWDFIEDLKLKKILIVSTTKYDYNLMGFWTQLKRRNYKCIAFYEENDIFITKFRKKDKTLILVSIKNFFEANNIGEAISKFIDFLRKWEENDMGNFALSLSSLAWNLFKHKFYHDIYIHNNKEALKLEEESFYTGRNEVYKFGKIKNVYKLDINGMYAYIMKNYKLPFKLKTVLKNLKKQEVNNLIKQGYGIIAKVRVRTFENDIPVRTKTRGVIYPVGEFTTYLALPEIMEYWKNILKFEEVAVYEQDYILKDFVEGVYNLIENSKIRKKLINYLFGRFAMKSKTLEIDKTFNIDIKTERIILEDCEYIKLGKYWYRKEKRLSENSLIAISSYITSYGRVILNRLMKQAKKENVYYCDTDGIIVNEEGYKNLKDKIGEELGDLKIEEHGDCEILGLKVYRFNSKNYIAGLKKNAVMIDKEKFEFEAWKSIKRLIQKGIYKECYFENVKKNYKVNTYTKGIVENSYVYPLEYDIIAKEGG